MKLSQLVPVFLLSLLFINCKDKDKEEQEPEKLISNIDGEEYIAKMNGEMNSFKAATIVNEGGTFNEEISYSILLNFSDSLTITDSTERAMYFNALNNVLHEFDTSDYQIISSGMFDYFLHYPKELTDKLNTADGFVVSTWTELLSASLGEAIKDPEITEKSVINVALKNCTDCSADDQEFIISFVESLKTYSDLSE